MRSLPAWALLRTLLERVEGATPTAEAPEQQRQQQEQQGSHNNTSRCHQNNRRSTISPADFLNRKEGIGVPASDATYL